MCERCKQELAEMEKKLPVLKGGADARADMAEQEAKGMMGALPTGEQEAMAQCSIVMAKDEKGLFTMSLYAKSSSLAAILEMRAAVQDAIEDYNHERSARGSGYSTDDEGNVTKMQTFGDGGGADA